MRTNSSSEIVTDVLSFFVAFSLNLYQVFIYFFYISGIRLQRRGGDYLVEDKRCTGQLKGPEKQ